jgi:hypothetical protein
MRVAAVSTGERCPECGAKWTGGTRCVDHFYQLLAWEWENPALLEVHHLMVLSYHLQHPSLYSPEGLKGASLLLADFVERGVTAGEARQRNRGALDSGRRSYKIKGTPDSQGAYPHPVQWTMTAPDVTGGGVSAYCENVRSWARSVVESLRTQLP